MWSHSPSTSMSVTSKYVTVGGATTRFTEEHPAMSMCFSLGSRFRKETSAIFFMWRMDSVSSTLGRKLMRAIGLSLMRRLTI